MGEADLAVYEQRFRRAGLPLFIEDFSAREDVWTRALPLLTLVFLGEVLGAIDLDWSLMANAGALAGGAAILVAAFAMLNRARGRRTLERPRDVGPPELVAFIVLPAMLPAVFGGQVTSALVTAAANLTLLALTYGVIAFGLLAIVRWAAARLLGQLAESLVLLARAIPLLLIFALVLFVNTEMWQVFGPMPDAFLVAIAVMLVALGSLFLALRIPREVHEIEDDVGLSDAPLERRQRANVGLVMFVAQALQVLVVSLAVGGFFVAFGLLAISSEVRESWIGEDGDRLLELSAFGEEVQLTAELLHVSGAIAAFAGLYYAIAVLTDATYREEFREELVGELRATFKDRAAYLKLLEGSAPAGNPRASAPRP